MYRQAERRRGGKTLKDLPACFFEFLTSAWRTPPRPEMSARTTAHYVHCVPVESPTSFRKEEHHSRTGWLQLHFHIPRFRQADPSSGRKHCRKERFLADWCGRVLSSRASLLCGTGRMGLKVWRESSRRWINFSSDKDTGPRWREEGVRAAGRRLRDL